MKALASYEEIGVLLHRKPDTIYRWAQKGVIPSVSVGDEYAFDLDEVARWIEVRTKPDQTGRVRQKAGRARN